MSMLLYNRAKAEVELLPPVERMKVYAELQAEQARSSEDAVELAASFRKYIPACWNIIEPATPFVPNWHIDAIAEHLEACSKRQITQLLIMMPPRFMKSSTFSVAWPTWEWIANPASRFLFSSYALQLSIRDALRSRRVIQSPWYQQRWGSVYHLTGDQNAKVRYENNYSGYRIATSVGGAATGEGGDYVGVDDPHNIEEIYSDVIRGGVLEWWDKVMSTRLNDPKRSVRIIVMQRAHENDLAGHVQNQGGWEVLKLPMEYEIDKRKTSIGWSDPRTKEGELLWPERFGREELTRLKKVLGPYGTAGQLQQRPAPEEGGIFKKAWFKLWPIEDTMPTLEYIAQTYDTAFTEDTRNDPSAGETWGLFKHPKSQRYAIILLDAWCEHLEYQDLRKRVKEDWSSYYGTQRDHRRPDIVLVEEKGSGITLLQDLRLLKIAAYGYNPHKADKLVRAHASVPFVFNGLVWLMESAIDRDHPVSWARAFLHEMLIYDKGVRDNYVDAFTQMILMFRNKQFLSAEVGGFEDEDEEDDDTTAIAPPERRVNPYAA